MNELANALQIQNLSGLILGWVGQALLFGTVLALITWAVLRCFGRRLHPALHAFLWMVVLAKFLVPVGPGFSFSLASAARGLTDRVGIAETEAQIETVELTATTSTGYIAWLPVEDSMAGPAGGNLPARCPRLRELISTKESTPHSVRGSFCSLLRGIHVFLPAARALGSTLSGK